MTALLRIVGLVAMLTIIAWAGTATFVAWDKHVEHERAQADPYGVDVHIR